MACSARRAPISPRSGWAALTAVVALLGAPIFQAPMAAATPVTPVQKPDAGIGMAGDGGVPSGVSTLSTNLTVPWGIAFLPNGKSAVVTERNTSKVWRIALDGSKKQIGTVPHSVWNAEKQEKGGLLGAAVSPTWNGTTDKRVFFMQTTAKDNRVVRMNFDGTSLSGYTPVLTGIRRDGQHNGGKIAFGPDGYLYIATGDAFQPRLAQDKKSLNGKILRVTKSGAAAPGNPFGTRVYSYGHRNPQGLAWDRNGRLWSAEIGHRTADELNLIKPGANYGWPTCEGYCSAAGMSNPKKTWTPAEGSPSQLAIVRNVIYLSALRGQRLWSVPIAGDSERVGPKREFYSGTYGRLRATAKVPGKDQLWLGTSDRGAGKDRILKVTIT